MRSNKVFAPLMLLSAVLVASCSDELVSETSDNARKVSSQVYAIVPQPINGDAIETKGLTFEEESLAVDFKWIENFDAMSVFSTSAGEAMSYAVKEVDSDNNLAAKFLVENFTLKAGAEYAAIYPNVSSFDPASVSVDFTTQRQNAINDISNLTSYMIAEPSAAKDNGAVFKFKHKNSWIIIRFLLKNDIHATKVVLSTTTPDAFMLKGKANVLTGEIATVKSSDKVTLYTGEYEDGLDIKAGIYSYFFMDVYKLKDMSDLTVSIYGDDGVKFTKTFNASLQFLEGKYYTIKVKEDGAALMPFKRGENYYADLSSAASETDTNDEIEIVVPGTYKLPNLPENTTIKAAVEGVVIDATGSGSIASIPNGATFEDVTFNFGQSDYHGFQHAGTINMNGCTLNGKFFSYGDMNFESCTFNQTAKDYNMWCYGKDVTYSNCVFNSKGKFLNIYNEANGNWNITATSCTFNSDTKNKAALNIKATGDHVNIGWNVVIKDCKVNDEAMFPTASGDDASALYVGSPLWQVDDRTASSIEANIITVTLDDVLVYPTAPASAVKIGTTSYETLAEAASAAKSGDEITLCMDLADAGKVKLPAGVTLNGNGHTISGNSAIDISAEGGVVTGVKFQNIHNNDNKLSAIYASKLTGSASVTNCTFDNCDWDAIQMEPQAGATIKIEGNTFSDDTTDGVQQQRFIHVQSAKNVDFTATISENIMTGDTKQGAMECYYFTDDAKISLCNNYIEDMEDVCILKDAGTFVSDMVFPAYTDAQKTATYSPAAMIQTSAYSAVFFNTLADAAAAISSSAKTVKLLADCENAKKVSFTKDVIIEGNGKTVTGRPVSFEGETATIKDVVFNNGKEGNESASYFTANVKNISIDGCTFNDAKWDAMQITSDNLQNVVITNCIFSNQTTGHRYIHIQPSGVLADAKLTITGNTFNNITKDYVDDSAVTIYRLMLSNMTIENNSTTGAGAGVLTTDEFWINNGADASDLMSQAAVCTAFGGEAPAASSSAAKINGVEYATLDEAIKAAIAANDGAPVELQEDIIFAEDAEWTPVEYNGGTVIINGNGHTVKGLPGMMFNKKGSGGHHIRLSNITFDGAKVNDNTGNAAVIIGYADSMNELYFENVTIKNSTVTGTNYAAAFVGYAAGYNTVSDGPVFQQVTFKNCTVENCTITGGGSTGALMGHATGNAWGIVTVDGATVKNNTITCTGTSTNKAGSLFGTVGAAGLRTGPDGMDAGLFVSANVSGNTVKSGSAAITTICGRQGSEGGTLVMNQGGSYDARPYNESDKWASCAEGLGLSDNGTTWTVVRK